MTIPGEMRDMRGLRGLIVMGEGILEAGAIMAGAGLLLWALVWLFGPH